MDGYITAPHDLTRYAALYVDCPNISRGHNVQEADPATARIDWVALLTLMLDSLETERIKCAGTAYTYAPPWRRRSPAALRESMMTIIGECRQRVEVVSSTKDIDPMIVNDLWVNTIKLSRDQSSAGRPLPHVVTVLLASGDNVYAQAISQIRLAFGSLLDLRLHTFCWRDRLSLALATLSQKVVYLDDCPGLERKREA
jgi:hypothetical protein